MEEKLVSLLIRHPRAQYTLADLGPMQFALTPLRKITRADFQIPNKRGLLLEASLFAHDNDPARNHACLVFLHGSSGCRVDGLHDGTELALHYGLSICLFDFGGCGHSAGEYMSLGFNEQDDVETVVLHLARAHGIKRFVLAGHSMGAVSAVLFASTYYQRHRAAHDAHLKQQIAAQIPSGTFSVASLTATNHHQQLLAQQYGTPAAAASAAAAAAAPLQTARQVHSRHPSKDAAAVGASPAPADASSAIVAPAAAEPAANAPAAAAAAAAAGADLDVVPLLCGLLLDSPFSQLWKLAKHVVDHYKSTVPHFVLSGAAAVGLPLARKAILKKIPNFDIKTFDVVSRAAACGLPAFFLHGANDDFVPPQQSLLLYKAYGEGRRGIEEASKEIAKQPSHGHSLSQPASPRLTDTPQQQQQHSQQQLPDSARGDATSRKAERESEISKEHARVKSEGAAPRAPVPRRPDADLSADASPRSRSSSRSSSGDRDGSGGAAATPAASAPVAVNSRADGETPASRSRRNTPTEPAAAADGGVSPRSVSTSLSVSVDEKAEAQRSGSGGGLSTPPSPVVAFAHKTHVLVPGGHNSERPHGTFDQVSAFLHKYVLNDAEREYYKSPLVSIMSEQQRSADFRCYHCRHFHYVSAKQDSKSEQAPAAGVASGAAAAPANAGGASPRPVSAPPADPKSAAKPAAGAPAVSAGAGGAPGAPAAAVSPAEAREAKEASDRDRVARANALHGEKQPRSTPFAPQVIVALHREEGVFLVEPWTGRLLERYKYSALGRIGHLAGEDVFFFTLQSAPDVPIAFWCNEAAELVATFDRFVDDLLKKRLHGPAGQINLAQIRANIEHAAVVLMDQQRPALAVVDSLLHTLVSLLGTALAESELRELVESTVIRVWTEKHAGMAPDLARERATRAKEAAAKQQAAQQQANDKKGKPAGDRKNRDSIVHRDSMAAAEIKAPTAGTVVIVWSESFAKTCDQIEAHERRLEIYGELARAYGLFELPNVKLVAPRPASLQQMSSTHSPDYLHLIERADRELQQPEETNNDHDRSEASAAGSSLKRKPSGPAASSAATKRLKAEAQSQVPSLEELLQQRELVDDCAIFPGVFSHAAWIMGSSILGAEMLIRLAGLNRVKPPCVINFGGGRHHAHYDRAGGYCYLNDINAAILRLLDSRPTAAAGSSSAAAPESRVLYLDVDVHHGDGVEEAFLVSPRVFTVSFHCRKPGFFPGSGEEAQCGTGKGRHFNLNVPLRDGVSDAQFMHLFERAIPPLIESFKPTAIVMQCGADGLAQDPVGVFNLSIEGLGRCFSLLLASRGSIPLLVLGGGGYDAPTVARFWTYLTALATGTVIDDDIPDNEFYGSFKPTFRLFPPAPAVLRDNANDEAHIAHLEAHIDRAVAALRASLLSSHVVAVDASPALAAATQPQQAVPAQPIPQAQPAPPVAAEGDAAAMQ